MPHSTARRRTCQLDLLLAQFNQGDDLPFAKVLPAESIETALEEEGASWREQVWTPVLTLWTFLSQVLCENGSCRAAVLRVLAWLSRRGESASAKTDPYCKARQRLPESLLQRLMRQTGRDLHRESPAAWRWKGRPVKLVDGTTVSMPDTLANQEAYPQPASQKPGVGFPLARMVVVFCLACGSVIDAALGKQRGKETGENALFRSLQDAVEPGDVLVADRYFAGWFDLALLRQRGVDAVMRLHHRRRCDFRRGRRLGTGDHVVDWPKPACPDWMSRDTYCSLPDELTMREVRVRVPQQGFRTRSLVVVTTLLDDRHEAPELALLYRARWHAELDLRSLKITLGLDVLRCKSPAMVRKEIWATLLAYNLIRATMAQAARTHGLQPRELSFQGALQTLTAFGPVLAEAAPENRASIRALLLLAITAYRVGDRPDRIEPRARKRRPKDYPHLHVPRNEARSYEYAKG